MKVLRTFTLGTVMVAFALTGCNETPFSTMQTQGGSLAKFTNPCDSAGILHNQVLDSVLLVLKRENPDSEEVLGVAELVIETILDDIGCSHGEVDQAINGGFAIAGDNDYFKNYMDTTTYYSKEQIVFFDRLLAIQQVGLSLPVLEDSLYAVNFSAQSTLGDSLAIPIYCSSSVLYHSTVYWSDGDNQQGWADFGTGNTVDYDWGRTGSADFFRCTYGSTVGLRRWIIRRPRRICCRGGRGSFCLGWSQLLC